MSELPSILADWFATRGWQPRRHQLDMLDAARAGRSALLVAPTGAGKTLAGFLPSLVELIEQPTDGLHTLYVSPLKALAVDVQRNLLGPIAEMGLAIRVETRTGDTPSDRKARQRVKPPQMLLTTPESLSLLLSYPDAAQMFAGLRTLVIDEVHAFAPTKRGDLLALSMARLAAPRAGACAASRSPPPWPIPISIAAGCRASGDLDSVELVEGEPGADPDIAILLPQGTRALGGPFGPLRRRAR